MQIKRIVGTAAAITAATLLAGAASTASNTVPTNGVAGYDSTTVSGVNVDTIKYNKSASNESKLASIQFISTDAANAEGATGTLTINDPAAPSPKTFTCTSAFVTDPGPPVVTTYTFTCDTSGGTGQDIQSVDSIGFTVIKDGTTV